MHSTDISSNPAVGFVLPRQISDRERRPDISLALAAAIEIQTELDSYHQLSPASQKACHLLAEATAADRIQIGWRRTQQAACELIADSQPADYEDTSFRAAAEETLARGGTAVYPPDDPSDRHSLLAVAAYAKEQSATKLVAHSLADRRGKSLGMVLAMWTSDTDSDDVSVQHAKTLLSALTCPLATKFAMILANEPTKLEQTLRALTQATVAKKRRIGVTILAVMAIALLIPAPYNIAAKCEIQPIQRRIIAAPFDGPLQSVLIRPGDEIESGQTLARMNPRKIDYELAGIQAELRQAIQQQKGMAAKHDFGASRIAKLDAERLRTEKELLAYQRENLDIRSPIDGVVVSGDWKQSEGIPLTKGETMFEIAPLDAMIVEIAIPEEDVIHARQSMQVSFYLHALPNQQLRGKIESIYPKAELRDHENVFIAKAKVQDTSGLLRPGMRGRASIRGDRHTLAWNVFHKFYYAARQTMGW